MEILPTDLPDLSKPKRLKSTHGKTKILRSKLLIESEKFERLLHFERFHDVPIVVLCFNPRCFLASFRPLHRAKILAEININLLAAKGCRAKSTLLGRFFAGPFLLKENTFKPHRPVKKTI